MKFDLHVHSDVSDGKCTREQIIKYAIENGIECLAFTEHNAYKEVMRQDEYAKYNLFFINGIEFDTMTSRSFHSLCYFKKFDSRILNLITQYNENVNKRSEMLLNKLFECHGIKATLNELQIMFGKTYIAKRDIIDYLIINHYAADYHEASLSFTGKTAVSYVPKYSLDFALVAQTIHEVGGMIFLAHPCGLNYSYDELERFIDELILLGLDGIEVVNLSKMSEEQIELYKYIACKKGLSMCGGSDFHDFNKHNIVIKDKDVKKIIKTLR